MYTDCWRLASHPIVNMAVINRSRNTSEDMNRCRGGVRPVGTMRGVLVFLCVLLCGVLVVEPAGVDSSCAAVKLGFVKRGFAASDLPTDPVEGRHLRTCSPDSNGRTCCSESVETKLGSHTRQTLDTSLRTLLSTLASVLDTRSTRFDAFFRDLLLKSKRDFHEMFKRTYGTIYLQNSDVFTDLFDDLESYYAKGQIDLGDRMDNFFINLYQRMFAVLNAQHQFDNKYLECVSNHMKELKPFGDVPHKLSVQLKRSFIATRTFAKAISVGADVVKNMLSIKPTAECGHSALRMQFCSGCAGNGYVKACFNYCINVMKGCFAYHADLETEWNTYVESMDRVAERLLGPFNIEMVVEPINIKISEAIMNFQDRGANISERVFAGCGQPDDDRRRRRRSDGTSSPGFPPVRLTRSAARRFRRDEPPKENTNQDWQFESGDGGHESGNDYDDDDTDDTDRSRRGSGTELNFETFDFNYEKLDDKYGDDEEDEQTGGGGVQQDPDEVLLETLVAEIRQKVKDSKFFWSHLPYQFCNNEEITESPSKEVQCWNGTAVDKYIPEVVGSGLQAQRLNPSVIVEVTRPSSALNEQVFKLKTITNKLKNAFNGMDVEWIDYEEPVYGSGSGSGDSEDDTEPDIESSGDHGLDENYNNPDGYVPPNVHNSPNHPSVLNNTPTHNTTRGHDGDASTGGGAASRTEMSLTRALITYLFPLVVVWFGGMFSDVL